MQMTSFLQTAIIFLLLTNVITALVAFYAMKAGQIRTQPQRNAALERKLQAGRRSLRVHNRANVLAELVLRNRNSLPDFALRRFQLGREFYFSARDGVR